ncbi:MAG: carboxypeptidase-like regulatory domain-containing protein, partial [Saprospiraceae bacterium]|nr:carboxypeptidase-like regulatory domain-containing protein [Saprospiraceae bacterium]
MKTLLFLLTLLAFAQPSGAPYTTDLKLHPITPTPTVLTGTVKDDQELLIGASVTILKGAAIIRGGITDIEGNYRITVDPGTYT